MLSILHGIELENILCKAQRSWLGTAEICEILRNHRKFKLTQSPPYRPPGIAYFYRLNLFYCSFMYEVMIDLK